MKIVTTDPMTGNDVADPESAPFVIEGAGENALKIHFESEASKQEYLEFAADSSAGPPVEAYMAIAGNEVMGTIN